MAQLKALVSNCLFNPPGTAKRDGESQDVSLCFCHLLLSSGKFHKSLPYSKLTFLLMDLHLSCRFSCRLTVASLAVIITRPGSTDGGRVGGHSYPASAILGGENLVIVLSLI